MMSENQKRNACRIMSEQERNRQNAKPFPQFIPMSSPQYAPLPPLSEIAKCQIAICKIMDTPYPHLGGELPVNSQHLLTSSQRLMDVLSGKVTPFHGAAEYLQNVRRGKA